MAADKPTTFDEDFEFLHWEKGFQRGWSACLERTQKALSEIYQCGYADGRRDGWREAKGRKKSTKMPAKEVVGLMAFDNTKGITDAKRATLVLDLVRRGRFPVPEDWSDQKVSAEYAGFLKRTKLRRDELSRDERKFLADLPRPSTVVRELRRQKASKKQ